ncbi:MAG: hypothetical protein JWP44_4421 [Mucilaginibacter sp.]|jgi:hypothetical protein|nr:hypothetical protein [Mucilaginibacter sp.]
MTLFDSRLKSAQAFLVSFLQWLSVRQRRRFWGYGTGTAAAIVKMSVHISDGEYLHHDFVLLMRAEENKASSQYRIRLYCSPGWPGRIMMLTSRAPSIKLSPPDCHPSASCTLVSSPSQEVGRYKEL